MTDKKKGFQPPASGSSAGTPSGASSLKVVQKQADPELSELEGADTTHFTIIDGQGNVVSVTSTISGPIEFGSMCFNRMRPGP